MSDTIIADVIAGIPARITSEAKLEICTVPTRLFQHSLSPCPACSMWLRPSSKPEFLEQPLMHASTFILMVAIDAPVCSQLTASTKGINPLACRNLRMSLTSSSQLPISVRPFDCETLPHIKLWVLPFMGGGHERHV